MTEQKFIITCGGVIALMLFSGAPCDVFADVVTIDCERDNTLYQSTTGDISNGAGEHFFVGMNSQGNERRGLLWFDIASHVPSGATINSVELTLHLSNADSNPQALSLHSMLSDWGEGTSDAPNMEGQGAPATPGDATWLHSFYDTSFWPGMEGGDFTIAESSMLTVEGVGFHTWVGNTQMLDEIAFFVDNPSANFGWMLLNQDGGLSSANRFDTRENANIDFRPTMTINYTIPSPPAFAILIGLLGIQSRRR